LGVILYWHSKGKGEINEYFGVIWKGFSTDENPPRKAPQRDFRHSDTVIVTKKGAEVITKVPKDFENLVVQPFIF